MIGDWRDRDIFGAHRVQPVQAVKEICRRCNQIARGREVKRRPLDRPEPKQDFAVFRRIRIKPQAASRRIMRA